MLTGDFNVEESESMLAQFLHDYIAVNIIHENTCYKSMDNLSCIDLIITSCANSFQNMSTFCTRLSDFYNFLVTVLKTSFRTRAPKELHLRDYNTSNPDDFTTELKQNLAICCST